MTSTGSIVADETRMRWHAQTAAVRSADCIVTDTPADEIAGDDEGQNTLPVVPRSSAGAASWAASSGGRRRLKIAIRPHPCLRYVAVSPPGPLTHSDGSGVATRPSATAWARPSIASTAATASSMW